MYAILVVLHIIVSLGLVLVVLLQSGKGTGLAGAFGGGGGAMGAVFGGRGAATFLSKLTTVLAIAFFISCLGHSLLVSRRFASQQESAVRKEAERQAQQTQAPIPLVPPPPAERATEGVEEGTTAPPAAQEGESGQ